MFKVRTLAFYFAGFHLRLMKPAMMPCGERAASWGRVFALIRQLKTQAISLVLKSVCDISSRQKQRSVVI